MANYHEVGRGGKITLPVQRFDSGMTRTLSVTPRTQRKELRDTIPTVAERYVNNFSNFIHIYDQGQGDIKIHKQRGMTDIPIEMQEELDLFSHDTIRVTLSKESTPPDPLQEIITWYDASGLVACSFSLDTAGPIERHIPENVAEIVRYLSMMDPSDQHRLETHKRLHQRDIEDAQNTQPALVALAKEEARAGMRFLLKDIPVDLPAYDIAQELFVRYGFLEQCIWSLIEIKKEHRVDHIDTLEDVARSTKAMDAFREALDVAVHSFAIHMVSHKTIEHRTRITHVSPTTFHWQTSEEVTDDESGKTKTVLAEGDRSWREETYVQDRSFIVDRPTSDTVTIQSLSRRKEVTWLATLPLHIPYDLIHASLDMTPETTVENDFSRVIAPLSAFSFQKNHSH